MTAREPEPAVCPYCGTDRARDYPHAEDCRMRGKPSPEPTAPHPGPHYAPHPARLPCAPIGDDPAYRDAAREARACDRCGATYSGPAVYCSLRCAQADALGDLAGAFLDRDCCCPDCGSPAFYAGPRGGMSQNFVCAGCGARFNLSIWRGMLARAERI